MAGAVGDSRRTLPFLTHGGRSEAGLTMMVGAEVVDVFSLLPVPSDGGEEHRQVGHVLVQARLS